MVTYTFTSIEGGRTKFKSSTYGGNATAFAVSLSVNNNIVSFIAKDVSGRSIAEWTIDRTTDIVVIDAESHSAGSFASADDLLDAINVLFPDANSGSGGPVFLYPTMIAKLSQPGLSTIAPTVTELINQTFIPTLILSRTGAGVYKSQDFALALFDRAKTRIINPFIEGSYGANYFKIARAFWATSGAIFNLYINIFQVDPSNGNYTAIDIETNSFYLEIQQIAN